MGCMKEEVRDGRRKLEGEEERYEIIVIEELIRRSRNDFMTSE